jgi:hypothetical protein
MLNIEAIKQTTDTREELTYTEVRSRYRRCIIWIEVIAATTLLMWLVVGIPAVERHSQSVPGSAIPMLALIGITGVVVLPVIHLIASRATSYRKML